MKQEPIDISPYAPEELHGKRIECILYDGDKLTKRDGTLEIANAHGLEDRFLVSVDSTPPPLGDAHSEPVILPLSQHLFGHLEHHPSKPNVHFRLFCIRGYVPLPELHAHLLTLGFDTKSDNWCPL